MPGMILRTDPVLELTIEQMRCIDEHPAVYSLLSQGYPRGMAYEVLLRPTNGSWDPGPLLAYLREHELAVPVGLRSISSVPRPFGGDPFRKPPVFGPHPEDKHDRMNRMMIQRFAERGGESAPSEITDLFEKS